MILRRCAAYPILFGAWPVLAVWSANLHEVARGDVLPLLGVVLLVTTLVWLAGVRVLGGWRRAAVAASAFSLLGQLIGRVGNIPPLAAVLTVGVVVAGVAIVARRTSHDVIDATTFVLNGVGIVVVTLAAAPMVVFGAGPLPRLAVSSPDLPASAEPATRDVFYVIPDRYGRSDTLEADLGVDATTFTQALTQRGFGVADESVANYPKTAHSLAASWHLNYLDELVDQVPERRQSDWRPLHRLLRDHRLGELVTQLGYEYIHIGMWWEPTSTARSATRALNYRDRSEFAQVYVDTTVWPAIASLIPWAADPAGRERVRAHTLYQLGELQRLADAPAERPRFVLAHLALPHEPYVFEADGSWVPAHVEAARSRSDNYERQLAFTNTRLLDLVDRLLAQPEEERPIIIIQADEGPHPLAYIEDDLAYPWLEAPDSELREKLTILTALYLPGVDVEVPTTLSPVNTFRLLFDTYHGTELGLLEDRAYVFPGEHRLYEFEEVTDRLR